MSPAPYDPALNDPRATSARTLSRTPSPTPSEVAELNRKTLIDFSAFKRKGFWMEKKTIIWCVVGVILAVLGGLFYFYHTQIVKALQPAANWMHDWLFGHEILAILCGLVWGVGIGFAITAAGTFIGEVGNFYAFKYCCHARGEKLEKNDIKYACLAKLVREGGFRIAVIARYSAIPGHFTTAIFAVCGMDIWTFCAAAFLSLPKQFVTVYIGVLLEDTNSADTKKNTILSYVVGTITFVVTVAAMHYITRQVNRVKPDIIYARRKARQSKLTQAYGSSSQTLYQNGGVLESTADVVFNPDADARVPLTASDQPYDAPYTHQKWDSEGRAVGYTGDPRLYAPQPRVPSNPQSMLDSGSRSDANTSPYHPSSTPLREESTDTITWESSVNNTNTGQSQSFRLNSLPPTAPLGNPFEAPLHNPFEGSTETVHQTGYETFVPPTSYAPPPGPPPTSYAPPPGPPPARVLSPPAPARVASPTQYAFGAPQHSFGSPRRVASPSPPSYHSGGGV
ncbi:snare associated Golgi protein-domain-containing protein [Hygrophoropsis aurantiaca]|uniref:Snare associated Golgi protein-domain-containing protein n=1 Tax=Hygrophoropsis aurantiaca TaxID=72124 RepID=A0ACB8ANW4_9AGAM|nr:snare associated Golgi protein-domain-containing protein [Hygrophoropsis aurantiaca]